MKTNDQWLLKPASEDDREIRMCTGKTAYDKRGAQTAINHFNRTRRGRHGNAEALRAYVCPYCGSWHLTSNV